MLTHSLLVLQRAWTQSQGYSAERHRQERLDYVTKNLKLEDFIISCGCHEFLPRKKKPVQNRFGSSYLMKPIRVEVLSGCCICLLAFQSLRHS